MQAEALETHDLCYEYQHQAALQSLEHVNLRCKTQAEPQSKANKVIPPSNSIWTIQEMLEDHFDIRRITNVQDTGFQNVSFARCKQDGIWVIQPGDSCRSWIVKKLPGTIASAVTTVSDDENLSSKAASLSIDDTWLLCQINIPGKIYYYMFCKYQCLYSDCISLAFKCKPFSLTAFKYVK